MTSMNNSTFAVDDEEFEIDIDLGDGDDTNEEDTLEAFLAGDTNGADWIPKSEDEVDWVMGKLEALSVEQKNLARRMKEKIASAKLKYTYYMNRYGVHVQEFAQGKISQQKRSKSYKFDHGTAGYRKKLGTDCIEIDVSHPEFTLWAIGVVEAKQGVEAAVLLQDTIIPSVVKYLPGVSFTFHWDGKYFLQFVERAAEHSDVTSGERLATPDEIAAVVDSDTGEFLEFAKYVPKEDEFYVKF